jgi:hypothetical protein
VLAIFFLGGIANNMAKTASKNRCTQSIMRSSLDGLPNFKCDASYVTLKRNDLEARGDLNEELKRKIADMMLACWTMTGSGKIDPYRTSFEVKYYNQGLTYLICDVVEFDNIPDFKGLKYWMAINKPASLKDSYFKVFNSRQATPEEMSQLKLQEDTYDTAQRYVVAWKHLVYQYRVSQDFEQSINNSIVFIPYTELVLKDELTENIEALMVMN